MRGCYIKMRITMFFRRALFRSSTIAFAVLLLPAWQAVAFGKRPTTPPSKEKIAELIKTQFECELVSVFEEKNGQILTSYSPTHQVLIRSYYRGHPDKCLDIPLDDTNGKRMGFSCHEINEQTVIAYNDTLIETDNSSQYGGMLKINLATGAGMSGYDLRWGWNRDHYKGEAILKSCRILK